MNTQGGNSLCILISCVWMEKTRSLEGIELILSLFRAQLSGIVSNEAHEGEKGHRLPKVQTKS
jgi:hypothetical protein